MKKTFLLIVGLCVFFVIIDANKRRPKAPVPIRVSQTEKDFIEGCRSGGATTNICTCMYQEFRFRYGDAMLGELNNKKLTSRYNDKINRIKNVCERNAQISANRLAK